MLLSRTADALYWLNRYLERAEHAARLISVRLDLGLDRLPGTDQWDFQRVHDSLRHRRADDASTPAGLMANVFVDPANPESLVSYISAARFNARQVREEISSDMWSQVNSLFLTLQDLFNDESTVSRPHAVAQTVIEGVQLFQGITDATMAHGEGWHYLQVGRFLERADATAALLDLHFRDAGPGGGGTSHAEQIGLLRSCAAIEAYCRYYTADVRPKRVLEFLLLSPEFPRSVRFAARRLEISLRALQQYASKRAGGKVERIAGRLHASLDYGQVDEILADDPHDYLEGIGKHCAQIHAAIYQSYIGYPIETALPA